MYRMYICNVCIQRMYVCMYTIYVYMYMMHVCMSTMYLYVCIYIHTYKYIVGIHTWCQPPRYPIICRFHFLRAF